MVYGAEAELGAEAEAGGGPRPGGLGPNGVAELTVEVSCFRRSDKVCSRV